MLQGDNHFAYFNSTSGCGERGKRQRVFLLGNLGGKFLEKFDVTVSR